MSEGPNRPRRPLFRALALARFRGPSASDAPHTLPPWRPGLVLAAGLILLGVALLWLI